MEAGAGVPARGLGLFSCDGIFLHSDRADLLCAKAAGRAIWLDVRLLWGVHRGMWRHARDGCMDAGGSFLLVVGRRESDDGIGLGTYGAISGSADANGMVATEPGGNQGSE